MGKRSDVKTVSDIARMFRLVAIKNVKEYDLLIADFIEKAELEEELKEVTHGLILPNGDVLLLCKANSWTDLDGLFCHHSVHKRSHETGKWKIIDKYYPEEFEPVLEMEDLETGNNEGLFGGFFNRA